MTVDKNTKLVFIYKSAQVHTGSGYILQNLLAHLNDRKGVDVICLTESAVLDEGKFPLLTNARIILQKPKLPRKGKRFFNWAYWLFIPTMVRNGVRHSKVHHAEAIISVFPDEYFMWAGFKMARKLGVPFIPWFHNTYAENRNYLGKPLARYMQNQIFKTSPVIFAMSDGLRDYYKRTYPKYEAKFQTLQHGFDGQALVNIPDEEKAKENDRIKFVYTGNLSLSYLDATARFFRVIGNNPNYELHVFSNSPESKFREFTTEKANIVYHGFVKDDRKRAEMISECDVCLIPLGLSGPISPVEYETIFPTRLISLLKSGIPLLVHAPDYSFLAKFIRKHDCGYVSTSPKDEDLMASINEMLSDKAAIRAKVENADQVFGYFEVGKTADILLNNLKGIIK